MRVWRVLLRHSAQLHDPSPHVAVDATYYERSPASKHSCDRTNYRVQTVEATKLVDTETQAILDVHCTTTRKGSDADVCAQLARVPAGELRTYIRVTSLSGGRTMYVQDRLRLSIDEFRRFDGLNTVVRAIAVVFACW